MFCWKMRDSKWLLEEKNDAYESFSFFKLSLISLKMGFGVTYVFLSFHVSMWKTGSSQG